MQCPRRQVEPMSVKETLIHDLRVIWGVLKKVGLDIVKALFWIVLYLAMAIWFVFNIILDIALLLTIRDVVQWFLGTSRRR